MNTRTRRSRIRMTNAAIVTFTCFVLSATTAFGGQEMEPLYNLTEARSLKPEIYPFDFAIIPSLFPVPQDNTVGTNDLRNAITLISFHKGKLKMDDHFRNAYDQLRGSGTYLPVFSGDTIGFGQSRRFLLFNFRNRRHERFRVTPSLEETIFKIAVADGPMRHFIFEIKEYDRQSTSHRDVSFNLQRLSLNDGEVRLVKKMPISNSTTWSVVDDKIFMWDFKAKNLRVLDMMFEPTHHPLADVINKHKNSVDFTWIYAHPTLPFAILEGSRYFETVISWGREDTRPKPLVGKGIALKQFLFSPDGKWLTFKAEHILQGQEKTYLMPVSEKSPNYLGSPILLSNQSFLDYCNTWTKNPTAFVAAGGDELYRWELTSNFYPEAGDMDLHDYIVQKDLEKLTREKRQGLGQD